MLTSDSSMPYFFFLDTFDNCLNLYIALYISRCYTKAAYLILTIKVLKLEKVKPEGKTTS